MPNVAIVEDHLLLAETLRAALGRSGVQARVVAPQPPDALLAALRAQPCDLVLLDLDLGVFGDATPVIAPLAGAGVRVLVVTGCGDRLRIAAALEQGAIGYQSKEPGFDALLAKVHAALAASAPLDPTDRVVLLDELVRARTAQRRATAPFQRLTARESETLRALAAGRSVADIAADWVVSETTVRSHVRGILAKLEVPSQLAAVSAALRIGWLTP
jgi:DNA-binding NarL/FixJ family response regulator